MWRKIYQYILLALLVAAGYFLLNYHIIYFGNTTVKLLKKSRPTSEYIFIDATNKKVESVMKIGMLREAGIGDLFVKMGKLNKEERELLEEKLESDPVHY